jgi:hypothetical protein
MVPGVSTQRMNQAARGNFINQVPIEDGDNQVRIISGPYEVREHWFPTIAEDSETGDKRSTVFPRNCTKTASCPICRVAKAETATLPDKRYSRMSDGRKFYFAAISRDEQKGSGETIVRPLKVPFDVFRQLKELHSTAGWGPIEQYDVIIRREKGRTQTGKQSRFYEYNVIPVPDGKGAPWTPEEQAAFEAVDESVFIAMAAPSDPETLMDFLVNHPLNVSNGEFIKNKEVVMEMAAKVGWPVVVATFGDAEEDEAAAEEDTTLVTGGTLLGAPAPAPAQPAKRARPWGPTKSA